MVGGLYFLRTMHARTHARTGAQGRASKHNQTRARAHTHTGRTKLVRWHFCGPHQRTTTALAHVRVSLILHAIKMFMLCALVCVCFCHWFLTRETVSASDGEFDTIVISKVTASSRLRASCKRGALVSSTLHVYACTHITHMPECVRVCACV